jgi:type II restriction/modification system DNA methylase subunit YeeA
LFGKEFWIDQLTKIGYNVNVQEFPLTLLREQKILPANTNPSKVYRLFHNGLMEIVVFEVKDSEFSRGRCVSLARAWKRNNLTSPIIILTNSKDSYISILPGTGFNSEAKVLYLSDRLYHTDKLVLESLKHDLDKVVLLKRYNEEFFPYQKVRDEFFTGYSKMFQELQESLAAHLGPHTRSFSQKFLGRLMFLYFLQKKGWLKNDKHFVDSIPGYEQLSNIYYNGLNTGKLEGIPFLNGSLFDREDYLSDEKEAEISEILNDMFLKARKFFNNYNFTVDETSSLEVEVSIDPALIGTVFENLLLEKERGKKGTFYTPKDETSFVCRRALVKYLGLEDGFSADQKEFRDGIQNHLEVLRKTRKIDEIRELKDKLLKVRVVDPAVGSGGFLVIMMQEIVSTIIEADAIAGWKSDPYEYKKEVHRNLFGFDIEPEAVEIARLRLWLSMIIDQEVPVPLPNLDFKIVDIPDSLQLQSFQKKIETEIEEERDLLGKLIEQYSNEHDHESKVKLKKRITLHTNNLLKYGLNTNVIESYMVEPADIVVMNPPYVRQEFIDPERKKYYIDTYKFDKKSDIYVYFFQRALRLLKPNGAVSAITSDKWLETSYGIRLQEHLKSRLISIYGQRNRSFEADVNTVITVYSNEMQNGPVDFTYLESYASKTIVRRIPVERADLKPGKWFYLRAPKMFMEKIYPKLTHKLGNFAEIKFGIKTGANDFFYMKDVSHLYEADYLSNPKKFEEWGLSAKNEKELKEQGLIYIENEGGERFVLNRADIMPVLRSPREISSYLIDTLQSYVFYPSVREGPGPQSILYIKYAENKEFPIKKGTKKGIFVRGIQNLRSVFSNTPNWYNLRKLKPTDLLSNEVINERHFTTSSKFHIFASDMFVMIYPKGVDTRTIWLYMNSTIFYMTKELMGKRMGGGALKIQVEDYEYMPVPDLRIFNFPSGEFFNRKLKTYQEEISMEDRRSVDSLILKAMDLGNEHIADIYKEYVELIQDRIIKGGIPLKTKGTADDKDN